jgi:[Skp1-protein]-hydroxyproline N-acetylglucosaminyltransferase
MGGKQRSSGPNGLKPVSLLLLILLSVWLFSIINVFIFSNHHIQSGLVMSFENGDKLMESLSSSNIHFEVDPNKDNRGTDSQLHLNSLMRGVIPPTPQIPKGNSNSNSNSNINSNNNSNNNNNNKNAENNKKSINLQVNRNNNNNNNNNKYSNPAKNQPAKVNEPWELKFPPVDVRGNVPKEDGEDHMPHTNLPVPRFWAPSKDTDIFKMRHEVNGFETIHLMLASYRDFQCRETITSAFNKADHPERLFIVAVDQISHGDISCLDIDVPCSQNPNQPICKYRNQISIYTMDAKYATGPVTARHIGNRMYRGEHFSMQLDAHCLFVRHWDTSIVDQWKSAKNEMAVLSTYLTDVQGSIDSNGDSTRNTRPIMCNSDFEGEMPARYLRHLAQPELVADIKGSPQLSPFWAAGFSFARGHFTYQVPYDSHQPMVFQGEEIAIGIRGFTFGYDFYAPEKSVVFHEYAKKSERRKKVPMFWENNAHAGEGVKSLKRATAIIGMARDLDPNSWDHTEEDKYGLGKVRQLDEFYEIFLINPIDRKAINLCAFVQGGDMHKGFTPFMKPDRMGIGN